MIGPACSRRVVSPKQRTPSRLLVDRSTVLAFAVLMPVLTSPPVIILSVTSFITCWFQIDKALREAHRVLKPGGRSDTVFVLFCFVLQCSVSANYTPDGPVVVTQFLMPFIIVFFYMYEDVQPAKL